MPIYEYACPDCGHADEHMQKLADAPIATCPKCGSAKYFKKISAAGFALKGSGWYVTDFKNGGTGGKAPAAAGESSASNADTGAAPAAAPAAPAAAPAPAPTPAPAASSK